MVIQAVVVAAMRLAIERSTTKPCLFLGQILALALERLPLDF
jgi:hypothetical protein